MPTFRLFIKAGESLNWLADVEAETAEAARATQLLKCLSFEFDPDKSQPLVGPEIKPSGKTCLGISFEVADDAGQPIAAYRRCGWSGNVIPPQADGEPCSWCERTVRNSPQGLLPSFPVTARHVLLPHYNIWEIVQVPE